MMDLCEVTREGSCWRGSFAGFSTFVSNQTCPQASCFFVLYQFLDNQREKGQQSATSRLDESSPSHLRSTQGITARGFCLADREDGSGRWAVKEGDGRM
jgi:hypothetical protein